MDDLNLDENLLSIQMTAIATLYIYNPNVFFFLFFLSQGMTNNVTLHLVLVTLHGRFPRGLQLVLRQQLVTHNTISSVVLP